MPLSQDTAANATPSTGRNPPKDRNALLVFCLVYAIGLSFAIFTDHAWEDFYIVYRTAKNLATGHGLVFTLGERVHVFTSPLTVLLLGGLSYATGNQSDPLVLWLFRVLSLGALAGAAVLLYKIAKAQAWGVAAICVLIGLFATDSKIIDFSINGMETGLMMLFLGMTLHALMVPGRRRVLRLGMAWAGLLWTRPDACVYIAFISGAFLLFQGAGRVKLVKAFAGAGVIAGAVYAPWVVWAWWYYGSPVPYTVIAKGLDGVFRASSALPMTVAYLIERLGAGDGPCAVFAPPYAWGWPMETVIFCVAMTWLASWYWLLPMGRAPARAVSLAFLAGGWYLAVVSPYPAPWYYPNIAILGIYVLAQIVQQASTVVALLKDRPKPETFRRLQWLFRAAVAALLAGGAVMLILVARESRILQRELEDGQRRQIGLWLRDHAKSSHDSVFLEPLGYIGYFSQLKMLDWPGIASKEVVGARRELPPITSPHWAKLIDKLHPDWLVLRPAEIAAIAAADPSLLRDEYHLAKVFDASGRLAGYPHILGRAYMVHIQTFNVYARAAP